MKERRHVKLFQRDFVPKIREGIKRSTIRGTPRRRKDLPSVGDIIDARAWTGLPYRSKQERIGEARIISCFPVVVTTAGVAGSGLNKETLAGMEGFGSWFEMMDWFDRTHGLPFSGVLIEWGVFKPAEGSR